MNNEDWPAIAEARAQVVLGVWAKRKEERETQAIIDDFLVV